MRFGEDWRTARWKKKLRERISSLSDRKKKRFHLNWSYNSIVCFLRTGDGAPICSSVWKSNKCGTEVLKYYFNPTTNMCEAFKYYSCLGNDNKFDSIQLCQDACVAPSK